MNRESQFEKNIKWLLFAAAAVFAICHLILLFSEFKSYQGIGVLFATLYHLSGVAAGGILFYLFFSGADNQEVFSGYIFAGHTALGALSALCLIFEYNRYAAENERSVATYILIVFLFLLEAALAFLFVRYALDRVTCVLPILVTVVACIVRGCVCSSVNQTVLLNESVSYFSIWTLLSLIFFFLLVMSVILYLDNGFLAELKEDSKSLFTSKTLFGTYTNVYLLSDKKKDKEKTEAVKKEPVQIDTKSLIQYTGPGDVEIIACGECGHTLKTTDRTCPECGSSVENVQRIILSAEEAAALFEETKDVPDKIIVPESSKTVPTPDHDAEMSEHVMTPGTEGIMPTPGMTGTLSGAAVSGVKAGNPQVTMSSDVVPGPSREMTDFDDYAERVVHTNRKGACIGLALCLLIFVGCVIGTLALNRERESCDSMISKTWSDINELYDSISEIKEEQKKVQAAADLASVYGFYSEYREFHNIVNSYDRMIDDYEGMIFDYKYDTIPYWEGRHSLAIGFMIGFISLGLSTFVIGGVFEASRNKAKKYARILKNKESDEYRQLMENDSYFPLFAEQKGLSENMGSHVVLLLFTFGIWYFVWIQKTTRRLNQYEADYKNETYEWIFCLLVPFYVIYWFYKSAKRLGHIRKSMNMYGDVTSGTVLLAIFTVIGGPIYLQYKMNETDRVMNGLVTIHPNVAISQSPMNVNATGASVTGATGPLTSVSGDFDSVAEELRKYKDLYDAGAITEEEFKEVKKKMLGL